VAAGRQNLAELRFSPTSHKRETRIYALFRGIRTVTDVIARFDPADEERAFGSAVRHPERGGQPSRGEAFRSLVYKKLSPVADIYFEVGSNDTVRASGFKSMLETMQANTALESTRRSALGSPECAGQLAFPRRVASAWERAHPDTATMF
jgi:hypothetical protein